MYRYYCHVCEEYKGPSVKGARGYKCTDCSGWVMAIPMPVVSEEIEFNTDELRVLEYVKDGLRTGRDVYGPLEVGLDKRDFLEEARQELRDAIVYMSCELQRLDEMIAERDIREGILK